MSKKKVIKATNRLSNLDPFGVDLVDSPAIEKRFLIVKRDDSAGVSIQVQGFSDLTQLPDSVLVVKDADPKSVPLEEAAKTLNSLLAELKGKESVPVQVNSLLEQARRILVGEDESTTKPQKEESEKPKAKKEPESTQAAPDTTQTEVVKEPEAKDAEPKVSTPPAVGIPSATSESSTTPSPESKKDETVHPSNSAEGTEVTPEETEAYLQEAIDREVAEVDAGVASLA